MHEQTNVRLAAYFPNTRKAPSVSPKAFTGLIRDVPVLPRKYAKLVKLTKR